MELPTQLGDLDDALTLGPIRNFQLSVRDTAILPGPNHERFSTPDRMLVVQLSAQRVLLGGFAEQMRMSLDFHLRGRSFLGVVSAKDPLTGCC
jgi:hypothetical protein